MPSNKTQPHTWGYNPTKRKTNTQATLSTLMHAIPSHHDGCKSGAPISRSMATLTYALNALFIALAYIKQQEALIIQNYAGNAYTS